jgi:cytochrome c oxidase assembly protein subunit 15
MLPRTYRRVTLVALLALSFIIVTGGVVRLTGSGMGCPQWPNCDTNRLVAPWQYHALVEFVNRSITGLVSVAVILAVLGSVVRRPRRRDLVLLSLGLVVGIVAQIVLGGQTVRHHLAPPFVMAHFLLSMVLVWDAVVLHHRAGEPDGPALAGGASGPGPAIPRVGADLVRAARLLGVAAALVIALGTVVTGSGPHSGSEGAVRLRFAVPQVARLHGIAVMVFLALTVAFSLALVRGGAPATLVRRAEALLAVLVAQAAVGYTQYFTGVPAFLVAVHIAGATAVWVATLRLNLAVVARLPGPVPGAVREPGAQVVAPSPA